MNHIPYHIPNIPIYNIIYSHLFRYIPIYYIPYIDEFCLNFAKGTDPPPAATTPLPPWGDGCARAKHEAAARFERWGLGVSTKNVLWWLGSSGKTWWFFIWLVVSTYPSEKWWSESQLGWWHSQLNGKIKNVQNSKPPTSHVFFNVFFLMVRVEWDATKKEVEECQRCWFQAGVSQLDSLN